MDPASISNPLFLEGRGGGGAPLFLFVLIVSSYRKMMDPFSISNPLFFGGGGGHYFIFYGSRPSKK